MSQQELLTYVVAALRRIGVEFMLTGSLASSLQGEARATHDIDLVAKLTLEDVQPLVNAFPGDRFYLSDSAIAEAIRIKRMFNLLEFKTGEKVDFWMLTDSPFDQSRFSRRQSIEIDGEILNVSSPEDTILMKLLWSTEAGGSEKQFNDALRVYELQAELLDNDYLQKWAYELRVEALLQRVIDEAEPFIPQ